MKDLVIIGCGAAGLTAAIYAGRADLSPEVITGILPGGLLTQTSDVENFPGFPEAVNGFELMFKFQQQAEHFGAVMVNDSIVKAELQPGGGHKLTLNSGEIIETRALIIATGASPRWLGLESEERLKNHGVSACATCDGAFYRDVPVVVIGGGDSAMEEALFLTKFASKVTVIHRRDQLRASKIMADRALKHDKIEFCWDSVVEEVLGDEAVTGVKIKNVKTGAVTTLECAGYFAALGHVPSTQLFAEQLELDEKGFIVLQNNSSYTNIDGVFAAGDCADPTYRQAITAAGMGARAAIDAERWLAE